MTLFLILEIKILYYINGQPHIKQGFQYPIFLQHCFAAIFDNFSKYNPIKFSPSHPFCLIDKMLILLYLNKKKKCYYFFTKLCKGNKSLRIQSIRQQVYYRFCKKCASVFKIAFLDTSKRLYYCLVKYFMHLLQHIWLYPLEKIFLLGGSIASLVNCEKI